MGQCTSHDCTDGSSHKAPLEVGDDTPGDKLVTSAGIEASVTTKELYLTGKKSGTATLKLSEKLALAEALAGGRDERADRSVRFGGDRSNRNRRQSQVQAPIQLPANAAEIASAMPPASTSRVALVSSLLFIHSGPNSPKFNDRNKGQRYIRATSGPSSLHGMVSDAAASVNSAEAAGGSSLHGGSSNRRGLDEATAVIAMTKALQGASASLPSGSRSHHYHQQQQQHIHPGGLPTLPAAGAAPRLARVQPVSGRASPGPVSDGPDEGRQPPPYVRLSTAGMALEVLVEPTSRLSPSHQRLQLHTQQQNNYVGGGTAPAETLIPTRLFPKGGDSDMVGSRWPGAARGTHQVATAPAPAFQSQSSPDASRNPAAADEVTIVEDEVTRGADAEAGEEASSSPARKFLTHGSPQAPRPNMELADQPKWATFKGPASATAPTQAGHTALRPLPTIAYLSETADQVSSKHEWDSVSEHLQRAAAGAGPRGSFSRAAGGEMGAGAVPTSVDEVSPFSALHQQQQHQAPASARSSGASDPAGQQLQLNVDLTEALQSSPRASPKRVGFKAVQHAGSLSTAGANRVLSLQAPGLSCIPAQTASLPALREWVPR